MANINLRPWREELRDELRKEFLAILGLVAAVAAVLVFLGLMFLNQSIEHQKQRNQFLTTEISKLDKRIAEIKDLKKQREELKERMRVIQELQGNRPVIVRLFDEIVRTLPGGVYFKSLSRSGDTVDIKGTAESNNKVSSLMRKLDESEWFVDPQLSGVKANPAEGETANDFNLKVKRAAPGEEEEE